MKSHVISKLLFQKLFHQLLLFSEGIINFLGSLQKYGKSFILLGWRGLCLQLVMLQSPHFHVKLILRQGICRKMAILFCVCLDANYLRAQVGVKLTSCLNIRSEPFCQSRIVYLSLLEIHLQNTIAKVKNACVCRMQRAHSMWNLKLCANIL